MSKGHLPLVQNDPTGSVSPPLVTNSTSPPTANLSPAAKALRGAGDRHQQRDVHLHFLLADGGRRALRPGQHGLLHRRHRRKCHRPGRPLVHPGRHAVQLRDALGLHRELLPLRPRRRLSRGQRGDGRICRQAFGFGPAVRLHPDRADQRRLRRAIYCRPLARRGLFPHFGVHLEESTVTAIQNWGAVVIACATTLYFFRQNLLGMHESSDKALKIMIATTIMALVILVWAA